MAPSTDETPSLRHCLRELAALSVLSAAWGRTEPPGIADSLAEVLRRSLPHVEFVYVRVKALAGDAIHECLRASQPSASSTCLQQIVSALGPVQAERFWNSARVVPNPLGEGMVRLAVMPIGYEGDCGMVIAGCLQEGFPSTTDRLLLDVAANQAAIVLQHKRSEKVLREQSALLAETDRRKDEFLAMLAHELRNPLAPIRSALQILKMPNVDATTAEQTRGMMERQLYHLVRLVDDLLDVSRVMRGKIELRKERVELATVFARAVETAQPLVQTQAHQLTVALPTQPLWLEADPVRLAQVVGNLLTNAAKYTERGGRIALTAQREGEQAVLRVRDNGIGIAVEMLPRIFDLFVQVDHARTRAQGGLGIGLTLVKNLVQLHQGTVQAHSDGLGQGSEFIVRLPLTTGEPGRQREKDQPLHPDPSSPRYRLLVVDDNKDAAQSLAVLLRLQGHEVRVAHDGPAALKMTQDYRPELVLLDIGMPGMDGFAVARLLRRQPGLEKVRLIALTGWGMQEDRRRTTEAGFDHHLVKPVEPEELQRLLGELPGPS